jgi:hypothetical protein
MVNGLYQFQLPSRLSALAALYPRGSLPLQLPVPAALCPAIYFSDAISNGRSGTKMSKSARPQLVPPLPLCIYKDAF